MRCAWAKKEPNTSYHDKEWGVPMHNDRILFEFLILEGAQAGLSWTTILNKRKRYKEVFYDFDVKKVAKMTEKDQQRLLQDAGIIRNRLKVSSAITNAQAFLKVQAEFGSFDAYLWGFVDNKPIVNKVNTLKDIPVSTTLSDAISKDLKKRGFRFVGSTIIYAFMQAIGMVNDHEVGCERWKAVQ